jgi:hypothetical protein
VAVGGGQEEEQGQAGAAAEQRMDAIAQQERPRVVVRSMPERRIRVAAPPGQEGALSRMRSRPPMRRRWNAKSLFGYCGDVREWREEGERNW